MSFYSSCSLFLFFFSKKEGTKCTFFMRTSLFKRNYIMIFSSAQEKKSKNDVHMYENFILHLYPWGFQHKMNL